METSVMLDGCVGMMRFKLKKALAFIPRGGIFPYLE